MDEWQEIRSNLVKQEIERSPLRIYSCAISFRTSVPFVPTLPIQLPQWAIAIIYL